MSPSRRTMTAGPIATAAALHLAASLPNFFIQQVPLAGGRGGPRGSAPRSPARGVETVDRRIFRAAGGAGTGPQGRRVALGKGGGVMRRREVLQGAAAALLAAARNAGRPAAAIAAALFQTQAAVARRRAFEKVGSKLRITGMKVFGVSLSADSDRPYVFVKLETNQGIVGWGEGTLEGKAGAVMACINDFRDFVIGADPMQVEHIWQIHVRAQLLSRRPGDRLGDFRHRPGALGYPRQGARDAGVQAVRRPLRYAAACADTITPTACARPTS